MRGVSIDVRADQVVALMRAGWKPFFMSGLYSAEVRLRKAGEPSKVFAYHVMRHLEKRRQVTRTRSDKGLTWTLREAAS